MSASTQPNIAIATEATAQAIRQSFDLIAETSFC
jgi:hypothetical protein